MPFTPSDLHKNTRAALESQFKSAALEIDKKIKAAYNGRSPAHVRISVDKAYHEPLLFDMIRTNYGAYGWKVTHDTQSGDMRDPYTIYYLDFKESPMQEYDSREGYTGGAGYFDR